MDLHRQGPTTPIRHPAVLGSTDVVGSVVVAGEEETGITVDVDVGLSPTTGILSDPGADPRVQDGRRIPLAMTG